MTIRIVSDSTCDLPVDVVQEWDIQITPVYINMEGKSYLDGVDLSRGEFYKRLPDADPLPTTSAPGIELPFSGEVTSAIGAHVGPGAIGIVCILKPSTGT